MKVRNKMKRRLHQSIEVDKSINDNLYLRSVTNNVAGKGKLQIKNSLRSNNKSMIKKKMTLQSDDLSDNSSDLEFWEKQRIYNAPENRKVSASIDARYLSKRKKTKMKVSSPVTIEDEQYSSSIAWYAFDNHMSPKNNMVGSLPSSIRGSKRKMNSSLRFSKDHSESMRAKNYSAASTLSKHNERYSKQNIIDSIRERIPSLSIVPIKGLNKKLVKNSFIHGNHV